MENIQSNHRFKTLDALAVAVALVALFIVAVPIVGRQFNVRNIELAKNETQFMSERLGSVEVEANLSQHLAGRMVASISPNALQDEMQKYGQRLDPWGHVYQVQSIKNGYGQIVALAVWSIGPDAHNDTDPVQLRNSILSGDVHFGGDDVGSIFSRR